jgi:hypothetical protein
MGMDSSAELHFGLFCESFSDSMEAYLKRSWSRRNDWGEARFLAVEITQTYGLEISTFSLETLQQNVIDAKEELKSLIEKCVTLAEDDGNEDCANWLRSIDVDNDGRLMLLGGWG